jgi:phosphoribosyl-AMP cyclohydrolase
MIDPATLRFSSRASLDEIERGTLFTPKFDADGLIPAIVSDHVTGNVLMFAFMNAEALATTVATGLAHFWSRSRNRLWRKGEESGNTLGVVEMRTDCDQDVVWRSVTVAGDGVACHTGETSCFYRRIPLGQSDSARMILEMSPSPASGKAPHRPKE